jgi:Family of unknown function (DUF6308)
MSPVRPVVLRHGVNIEDPLGVVLGLLPAPGRFDVSEPSRPTSFGEPDLRLANRSGARISAAQIAAILQRRPAIEHALRSIQPAASLSAAVNCVPWLPLRQLFDAFAEIPGVGLSKMTKALYPKRPALIPMLDSMVQAYLRDDDPGAQAPFAERALGLVRGYQRDLDHNQAAVRAVRQELARRGYGLTEVRILDLLILSAQATAWPTGGLPGTAFIGTENGSSRAGHSRENRCTSEKRVRLRGGGWCARPGQVYDLNRSGFQPFASSTSAEADGRHRGRRVIPSPVPTRGGS